MSQVSKAKIQTIDHVAMPTILSKTYYLPAAVGKINQMFISDLLEKKGQHCAFKLGE